MARTKLLFLFIILTNLFALIKSQDSYPCLNSLCRKPSECENLKTGNYVCHCRTGIRGKYCERLMENGENLCQSSPCWFGGTCIGNSTDWLCLCPPGKTGINCKNYLSMADIIVKIKNKGFYVAKLSLFYRRVQKSYGQVYKQTGSITIGQDYAFYMPYDTDLTSTLLVVHAVAGKRVMTVKIDNSLTCFHTWGTTLFPAWSPMPCW